MGKLSNKSLTGLSQNLRKNMTKEEKHLWYDFLKLLDVNVKRQKVFGKYILDFYINKYKIAIELDGSQHYENVGKEKDNERDEFLGQYGIRVLRYSNLDVNRNFDAVCMDIMNNFVEQSDK